MEEKILCTEFLFKPCNAHFRKIHIPPIIGSFFVTISTSLHFVVCNASFFYLPEL